MNYAGNNLGGYGGRPNPLIKKNPLPIKNLRPPPKSGGQKPNRSLTATTSAIPPAVIAFEARLTKRLFQLYLKGTAILVNHSKGFNDVASGRRIRRDTCAQKADKHCNYHRFAQNNWWNAKHYDGAKNIRVEGKYFQ